MKALVFPLLVIGLEVYFPTVEEQGKSWSLALLKENMVQEADSQVQERSAGAQIGC